jgi:hypothetical protein
MNDTTREESKIEGPQSEMKEDLDRISENLNEGSSMSMNGLEDSENMCSQDLMQFLTQKNIEHL